MGTLTENYLVGLLFNNSKAYDCQVWSMVISGKEHGFLSGASEHICS